jgi:PHD/YefM family antitoxin component YafN of YafNO toxin-antitoxin module
MGITGVKLPDGRSNMVLAAKKIAKFRKLSKIRIGDYVMVTVTATEFAKNFGRYREVVQAEPVEVTSHDRVTGYFISRKDFETLQRVKGEARDSEEAEADAGRAPPDHPGVSAFRRRQGDARPRCSPCRRLSL